MILWSEITIRLVLACVFGAVIGLERERKDWVAGLRTHMMVCVGACLTMLVSAFGFSDVLGNSNHMVLDPSRVAAQVISGIGFIGAGTILFLRQRMVVRGLTTASGLWTVAAIGLATGGGMYFAALMTTLLALIILWILQPLEKKFSKRFREKSIKVTVLSLEKSTEIVNKIFQESHIEVAGYLLDKTEHGITLTFKFKRLDKPHLQQLISEWQTDAAIKEVVWNS